MQNTHIGIIIQFTEIAFRNGFHNEQNYGTGSYPLPPQGWHFENLFKPSQKPLKIPCLKIAPFTYSEHVGLNLQLGGKRGEMLY